MIKTPLSTMIGGAFWTPSATILGGASKTFNQLIKSLFANSEQGFFYDPNDLSTMFQDAAGTVPVTGAGQPVGLMLDKSGRNNHARQTTSASRPILRQNAITGAYYLEFDGSDDFLVTNSINFTSTDKVSLFVGVRKQSTTLSMLCELSSNSSAADKANAFYISVPETSAGICFFRSRTQLGAYQTASASAGSNPRNCVITAKSDIPNDLNTLSIDGVSGEPSTGDLGVGNFGNYPLYVGRRGGTSLPFMGHIYSLIGVGRLTSNAETVSIEKELAKRTGVTLNV